MPKTNNTPRVLQNIYFIIALSSTLLWLVTFGLTALVTSGSLAPEAVPIFVLEIIHAIYYYQIAHFILGFVLLFYIIRTRRKGLHETRAYKTVVGLILTPANFFLIITALVVLGLNVAS
ncbi:MAG TPA: hypothetical protein VFD05_02500 [Bacilli bacterium]|nr:hypothetical protein [Bacilli bacterium]